MRLNTSAPDAVDEAVNDGRQLFVRRKLLAATAWGFVVALSALLLLLLLGSSWFPTALLWVGIIGGILAAAGVWKKFQTTDYEIAQALDRSWDCADQLSTACYFSSHESNEAEAVQSQRKLAARTAAGRDASSALALKIPTVVWYAAALLFAVVSMVGLRYSVSPQLALSSPLLPLLFPGWASESDAIALVAGLENDPPQRDLENSSTGALSDEQLADAREAAAPNSETTDPLAALGEDPAVAVPEVEGLDELANAGDQMSFDDPNDGSQPGAASDEGSPDEHGSNLEREAEPNERPDSDGDWGQQSNSLLDRLKEALKQLSEGQGSEVPDSAQQESEAAQDGSSAEASQEPSDEGAAEAGSGQGAPAEAAMESDDSETEGSPQSAQDGGESSGTGNEGDGESAGAAGDGDGNKAIEETLAQQETFEALEEFYLRRAEELSGDVLVETTTGEGSTAATPYRVQSGTHSDDSGLALRDQAPAAYRTFVENYFREIRSKEE